MNTQSRGYVICTAPRSGSNWLCQLLSSTGVLGHPLEYFNAPGRRSISDPSYPGIPRKQVGRILTSGRTDNGIYGLKIFASQFRRISHSIQLTRELPDLRFVYLTRADLLGQAISWTRALQTERYRSTQAPRGVETFDSHAITRQLRKIAEEYRQWSVYFARTGVVPVELVYEQLQRDPEAGIDRIAGLFGISAPARTANVDLQVQRDELTEDWRRRFIKEMGDPACF